MNSPSKKLFPLIPFILIIIAGMILLSIVVISLLPPSIVLGNKRLVFGAVYEGVVTCPQKIDIEIKNKILDTHNRSTWKVKPDKKWISVRPSLGKGKGIIKVRTHSTHLHPGTHEGKIRIFSSSVLDSPREIEVILKIFDKGKSFPPFGYIDIPQDGQKIDSPSFNVWGWALDDIEVVEVKIKREPFQNDLPSSIESDGFVFIGDADIKGGIRSDVEKSFPLFPLNTRSGWGFYVSSKIFSSFSEQTIKIHAVARDKEGHLTDLGSRKVVYKKSQ